MRKLNSETIRFETDMAIKILAENTHILQNKTSFYTFIEEVLKTFDNNHKEEEDSTMNLVNVILRITKTLLEERGK